MARVDQRADDEERPSMEAQPPGGGSRGKPGRASPAGPNEHHLHLPRERWVEILVVTIFGGILFTVAANQFSMKGELSGMNVKLEQTGERVKTIATEFPSLAHKLAIQETTSPAKAIVVATRPQVTDSGR
jgi:hypothetical protein